MSEELPRQLVPEGLFNSSHWQHPQREAQGNNVYDVMLLEIK